MAIPSYDDFKNNGSQSNTGAQKQATPSFEEFSKSYKSNLAPEPSDAFTSTAKATGAHILNSLAGQPIEDIGQLTGSEGLQSFGQGVREYAEGVQQVNPSQINTLGDIVDKPGTAIKTALGNLVPQIPLSMGGAYAGAKAGAALPVPARFKPITGAIGAGVGMFVPSYAQEYAEMRGKQHESGQEDMGKAALTAVPAAGLETLADASVLGRLVPTGMGSNVLKEGANRLAHVGKQAAKGFGIEAGTEYAQTGLEQYGGNQDLTTEQAADERNVSAALGGIGGGIMRGGISAFDSREVPQGPLSRAASNAAPQAENPQPGIRPWETPSYADYKTQTEEQQQGYVPGEVGQLWETPSFSLKPSGMANNATPEQNNVADYTSAFNEQQPTANDSNINPTPTDDGVVPAARDIDAAGGREGEGDNQQATGKREEYINNETDRLLNLMGDKSVSMGNTALMKLANLNGFDATQYNDPNVLLNDIIATHAERNNPDADRNIQYLEPVEESDIPKKPDNLENRIHDDIVITKVGKKTIEENEDQYIRRLMRNNRSYTYEAAKEAFNKKLEQQQANEQARTTPTSTGRTGTEPVGRTTQTGNDVPAVTDGAEFSQSPDASRTLEAQNEEKETQEDNQIDAGAVRPAISDTRTDIEQSGRGLPRGLEPESGNGTGGLRGGLSEGERYTDGELSDSTDNALRPELNFDTPEYRIRPDAEAIVRNRTKQGEGLQSYLDNRNEQSGLTESDLRTVNAWEQPQFNDNRNANEKSTEDLTGEKINRAWTKFSDDSGSLNVPRAEMPQVKAEHRGALVKFLNAKGISHEKVDVSASELKPTQAEFSPSKVKKAQEYKGGNRSILISSDNHVVDGHHQWLAKMNSGENIEAIRLNAPISQLLNDVKQFPSVEKSNGAKINENTTSTNSTESTVTPNINESQPAPRQDGGQLSQQTTQPSEEVNVKAPKQAKETPTTETAATETGKLKVGDTVTPIDKNGYGGKVTGIREYKGKQYITTEESGKRSFAADKVKRHDQDESQAQIQISKNSDELAKEAQGQVQNEVAIEGQDSDISSRINQEAKSNLENKANVKQLWQMTSDEFANDQLNKSGYRKSYKSDEKLKNAFLNEQKNGWKKALEERAQEGRLPDDVIDDFVNTYGQAALHSTFRGTKEKGIAGWMPKDVREQESPKPKKLTVAEKQAYERTWQQHLSEVKKTVSRKLSRQELKEEQDNWNNAIIKAQNDGKQIPDAVIKNRDLIYAKRNEPSRSSKLNVNKTDNAIQTSKEQEGMDTTASSNISDKNGTDREQNETGISDGSRAQEKTTQRDIEKKQEPVQAESKQDEVSEEDLISHGLLYHDPRNDRWKYKFHPDSSLKFANSKESAIERAREAFKKWPESERKTKAQQAEEADKKREEDIDKRYSSKSVEELEKLVSQLEKKKDSLYRAGQREFNGNGGRRTSAAVSSEAARDTAEEIRNIEDHIQRRKEKEPAKKETKLDNANVETKTDNVVGKGNTGEVYRIGDEVEKNSTNDEAKVYELLKGVEGIAQGYEKDGKIRLPFYKHIISVDTIERDKREQLSALVSKNVVRINGAISALINAGYAYNDPLQFGLNDKQQLDLLDFSNASKSDGSLNENLMFLSGFYKQFGATRQSQAISQVREVIFNQHHHEKYGTNILLGDEFDGVNYKELTDRLEGKAAQNAYYATNARYVQLKDIAQTDNIEGIKVVLSLKPLSQKDIKSWELVPVYTSEESTPNQPGRDKLNTIFKQLGRKTYKSASAELKSEIDNHPDAELIKQVQKHWSDVLLDVGYENKADSNKPNSKVFIEC